MAEETGADGRNGTLLRLSYVCNDANLRNRTKSVKKIFLVAAILGAAGAGVSVAYAGSSELNYAPHEVPAFNNVNLPASMDLRANTKTSAPPESTAQSNSAVSFGNSATAGTPAGMQIPVTASSDFTPMMGD